MIKCDTAFLPGSVGVGAGKEDWQEAIKVIQARKKELLARSAEEAVAGADAAEEGKPREYLHPKRGRTEDDGEARMQLTSSLSQLVAIKAENAVEQKTTTTIDRLNHQLDIYLGY